MEGIITRSQSGFYEVATDSGQIICELRGKLKKGRRTGDVAAVGDTVILSKLNDGSGMIEEIKPRHSLFTRLAPTPQGEYQQILIANLDQAVLVFSCAEPAPRLRMLDRFLVISEKQGVPALVVANKTDLVSPEGARGLFGRYSSLGYPVLYTSAKTGFGAEDLKEKVIGKLSLFAGPSGAGKSSLLNVIQPGLGLSVRQVSSATSKGKHTTVVREMFALDEGGFVADTPGLKALALYDIEPEELDGYFPEMRPLVGECSFSDCTHVHEPGCGILAAVKEGRVHPERYQSYLRMRFGDDD